MYRLTLVSAQYTAGDLNGNRWDLFSGDEPPDAYARVFLNGDRVATTATRYDDYSPEWSKSVEVYFTASSVVTFKFYDKDDVSNDDYAGSYDIVDLAAAVRSGGRSDVLTGIAISEVAFTIDPL